MGEYTFADVNNLEHCTKYLNQTLVTFGFPASLDLFANDPVSTARTATAFTHCFNRGSVTLNLENLPVSSDRDYYQIYRDWKLRFERLESQLQAKDRRDSGQ
ncbi:hypothetical protein NC653_040431 [Populus alba x Populus x berolinensis]|uniref:Uncharacterized protein n=1 Tax=Populus alba x Populus x berolinensis TaxID=444605 RepID=A0AAD6PRS1_9ROSI|nr:hypothetical protein NC653_040431 [Populus alba x Populus x berolinensis]